MAAKDKGTQRLDAADGEIDPIRMLIEDHREVSALFEQYERIKDDDDAEEMKAAIVERVCAALRVHTELEEQIFYPALRSEIEEEDLLDEAQVEHDGAKRLVDELEDADPDEPLYDAKVKVLSEYIKHHVKEEENEMFKQARSADVDLKDLGRRMAELRLTLEQEYGLVDDLDDEDEDEDEDDTAARTS